MKRDKNTHNLEDSKSFAAHARRAATSHKNAAMKQVKEAARTGDQDLMVAAIDDLMLATYYLGAADTHDQYAAGSPRFLNPDRRRGMAALGGFAGSLAGAVVASAAGLGGLGLLAGSAGGGALGASSLAADDRKRRAAGGGALGGILGPLGAAAGAAIASADPDTPRQRNAGKVKLKNKLMR